MAPSFLSKFVRNNPSNNGVNSPSQRSRSPSPALSNRQGPPPAITIDPSSPTSGRPRRHTTVGGSPPYGASTESFPNVTVVPPSPRSVSQGSDLHGDDQDPTPKSAVRSEEGGSDQRSRVPSLSHLSSPRRSGSSTTDDENATTPTPATGRTSFSEKITERTLSHSRSTGNLKRPRTVESSSPALSLTSRHPKSATDHMLTLTQPSQESLHSKPARTRKSSKASKSSKLRGSESPSRAKNRHERAASVSSVPSALTLGVSENGVFVASPMTESPPGSMDVRGNNLTANLLSPGDLSDSGSVHSATSTATSSKKKRTWPRKSSNANSITPGGSPALSTASLSPSKRKPTQNGSLASAIASSGLTMANAGMGMTPLAPDLPPTPGTSSSLSSRRPRSASTGGRSHTVSGGYAPSEISDRESYYSGHDLLGGDNSPFDDDDEDDLDLDADDIPVTGFAVASNKRNQDFHELFPTVPEGDYLIDDYGCALQREILIQGRLYVSENHLCFHANIFGWITDLTIPMAEVTALEKRMTAFVIPNAIQVTTIDSKYTFASFLSRDTTFDVLYNVWRLARPEGSSSMNSRIQSPRGSLDGPTDSDGRSSGPTPAKSKMANKTTQCACGKAGEHLAETAMESTLPGTPDKIYNLMFTSGFIKDFMTHDQNLTDLQISDWTPTAPESKLLYRQMSYIKPLSGGIGPKSTKCELRDEMIHCEFDDYVTMLTTTRTPDVPSGGVFSVKTRTCITWASAISTKVIVTTQVEWTGRSFIKSIIEKSAIDGQKQYHIDLDKSMRRYIHEHQSEFIPEGVDASVVEETEAQAAEDDAKASADGSSAAATQDGQLSRDYVRGQRGLQWAYDTFEGALKVTKQSVEGLFELVKDVWDQPSTTTILYFIIVFLVISNIWTLIMVGKREEIGRRKELRRTEEREKWVQGVVHTLWEELIATRNGPGNNGALLHQPRVAENWFEEANDLRMALDYIEERVHHIRGIIPELD